MYLAKIAAVEDNHVAASGSAAAGFPYVPGIVGGNVAIFDVTTFAMVSAITGTTNPYGVAATPDGAEIEVRPAGGLSSTR